MNTYGTEATCLSQKMHVTNMIYQAVSMYCIALYVLPPTMNTTELIKPNI